MCIHTHTDTYIHTYSIILFSISDGGGIDCHTGKLSSFVPQVRRVIPRGRESHLPPLTRSPQGAAPHPWEAPKPFLEMNSEQVNYRWKWKPHIQMFTQAEYRYLEHHRSWDHWSFLVWVSLNTKRIFKETGSWFLCPPSWLHSVVRTNDRNPQNNLGVSRKSVVHKRWWNGRL